MNVLEEIFDDIGDTRAKVARTLRKAGARGKKGDPYSCPVAEYLKLKTGARSVLAFRLTAAILNADQSWAIDAAMPAAVTDFIDTFDAGRIARDLRTDL